MNRSNTLHQAVSMIFLDMLILVRSDPSHENDQESKNQQWKGKKSANISNKMSSKFADPLACHLLGIAGEIGLFHIESLYFDVQKTNSENEETAHKCHNIYWHCLMYPNPLFKTMFVVRLEVLRLNSCPSHLFQLGKWGRYRNNMETYEEKCMLDPKKKLLHSLTSKSNNNTLVSLVKCTLFFVGLQLC